MISGILPTTEVLQKNISWESHLIGGFVGIFVAYFFKEEMEEDEKEEHHYADEEQKFYFERDVFDKTLEQRHLEQLEQERLRQLETEERRQQQFPYSNGWFSNDTFS